MDYHKNTKANFKQFDNSIAKELIQKTRYKKQNSKIELKNGDIYEVLYISISKNSFFKSRSASFYYRKKGGKSIIRISDHWSKSNNNDRSRKLNCGYISSCYWTINNKKDNEIFVHGFYSGKYPYKMLAGICYKNSFEKIIDL